MKSTALFHVALFLAGGAQLLTAVPAAAQEVEFPLPQAWSEAALEQALPGLARQALAQLPDDPSLRLEYQFHFQLASDQCESALATLDEWNKLSHAPVGNQAVEPLLRLELNARAQVVAAREKISFGEAFKQVLAQKFAHYNDRAAADSAWSLGLPLAAARNNFENHMRRIKDKRALTAAELVDLLQPYEVMRAVESMASVLDDAIAVDDASRFIIQRGVQIKTKEGATITVDVVRPKRLAGPQPTALRFTIYADLAYNIGEAKQSAARGYVGVQANARGKYLSRDKITPWETEVQDTWAVIDWISQQPWSNGQVGMYGHSYDAFATWAAAKSGHPALKTIVASSASSPGNGLPMQNNVFQTANYGWPLQTTSDRFMGDPALMPRGQWNKLAADWFESGRPFREIDVIDGRPNPVLQKQLLHPSYDEYWQAMQPYGPEFTKIRIPILTLTGYYDDANAMAVEYLAEHYRYNPEAEHYLVIGPYPHQLSATKNSVVNGYTVDPVAQLDSVTLVYEWFDHVLRGGPMPALLKDRINFEVMGANTWRHAPSLVKMSDRGMRLYLTAQKAGTRYELSRRKPETADHIEQTVDLTDRKTYYTLYPSGAYRKTVDSPNWLTYVTEPFEESVSINGQLTGVLTVALDRKDFDFTLALYEEMPDGRYFNLSYYVGRASYASDRTGRHLLTPEKGTALPFSRTPLISRQLSKGSRLVLLVTVNKNPFAQVNYGTGKDVSDESVADARQPLRVDWFNDSYITVPISGLR